MKFTGQFLIKKLGPKSLLGSLLGATTLNTKTFSITTFSITKLSIKTFGIIINKMRHSA